MASTTTSPLQGIVSLSSHILDTTIGKPAQGVQLVLDAQQQGNIFTTIAKGTTNADGRVTGKDWQIIAQPQEETLVFRLTFHTASYFESKNTESFYPMIQIIFKVQDAKTHYHVPLLLNAFGYSTYRGS